MEAKKAHNHHQDQQDHDHHDHQELIFRSKLPDIPNHLPLHTYDLEDHICHFRHRRCLIDAAIGSAHSYGDLDHAPHLYAGWLRRLDMVCGGVVMLVRCDCPAFVSTFLAVSRLHATANPSFTPAELA